MKTFTLHSKYEAPIEHGTRLYVLDPTSIKIMPDPSDIMGHPVYSFHSESWSLKDGKRSEDCSIWEGRQNTWGIGSNHAGHILTAIIAQRDAAIELIHDIHNEVMIDGGLGEEMGKRIKKAIGAEL